MATVQFLAAAIIAFISSVNAACDTAAIAAKTTAAQTLCDVQDLSFMRAGDEQNSGTVKFCDATCIAAVNDLVQQYSSDCPDTETRRLHNRVQREQYECSPPSAQCQTKYFDYLYWTTTADGIACAKQLKALKSVTGSAAQEKYAEYCSGTCATQISDLLTAILDVGCASWAAYVDLSHDHTMTCLKKGDTYCLPDYQDKAATIAIAASTTSTVSDRNAALGTICTECFVEIQKQKDLVGVLLGRQNEESELCIKEGTTYCAPVVDSVAADVIATPGINALNTFSRSMCADSIGRCAGRIWAHRYSLWHKTDAEKTSLSNYLKYACQINRAGSKCGNTMQLLLEGKYTQSSSSGTCEASSVGGQCLEPAQCRTWNSPSTCEFGCSQVINVDVETFGCCFNSMKDFHVAQEADVAAVRLLFARHEFLTSECCGFQGSGCAVGLSDACGRSLYLLTLAYDAAIPFSFYENNAEAFNSSVTSDLAANLGVDIEAVALSNIESLGDEGTSTRVTFIVSTQSEAIGNQVRTTFEALVASNTLLVTKTDRLYATRCNPEFNENCNGASTLTALSMMTMLLVAFLHTTL